MNDFDDMSDLDEVFGPLRSSATPAELSQETAVLGRMARVHRTAEGKHMFTSRRARVATLVAAGVLGFGGMAAASPSLLGDRPTEPEPAVDVDSVEDETIEPTEEVEPVEVESVEPEGVEPQAVEVESIEPDVVEDVETIVHAEVDPAAASPAEVAPLVDDLATTFFDESTCRPGNHGATVSAVARGEYPEGVSVTDAAHSSCGKKVETEVAVPDVEADTESDDEPEGEVEDQPEVVAPEAEAPDQERPGRDNGKGNGNSNGNGNGNSNGNGGGNGNGGKRGG